MNSKETPNIGNSGLGIVELFTISTLSKDTDWESVTASQNCSYTDSKCFKTRKSQPDISIGTCTVSHNIKNPKNVIICPVRFVERNQIFFDCIHLLKNHEPGNELHRIPEVSIPGGNVDFCLESVRSRIQKFEPNLVNNRISTNIVYKIPILILIPCYNDCQI